MGSGLDDAKVLLMVVPMALVKESSPDSTSTTSAGTVMMRIDGIESGRG